MKSGIFIIFCLFLFWGCQTGQQQEEKSVLPSAKKEDKPTPVSITTAMPVHPFQGVEDPFYMDSLMVNETTETQTNIFRAYFPQSKDKKYEKLSLLIRTFVENYFEMSKNVSADALYYYLDFWLTGYSVYEDFVSMEFTEQEYSHGAAHYVHAFKTINFDLKKQKEIGLRDFLLFKEGEIEKFCDAFNPDRDVDTREQTVYLDFYDFSETQSFLIADDGIILLFNDYEKGPSMTKIRVPYSKIKGYVNPEYRILFE